jgi:hypothetical protein
VWGDVRGKNTFFFLRLNNPLGSTVATQLFKEFDVNGFLWFFF